MTAEAQRSRRQRSRKLSNFFSITCIVLYELTLVQTNLKARRQCSLAAAERSASISVACGTTSVVGTALDVLKMTPPPPAGLTRARGELLGRSFSPTM